MDDKVDISAEQLIDIAYLFGKTTQILYHGDINFIEQKAKLKPPYLNVIGSFDMYSWLGLMLSFTLVCVCHQVISYFKKKNLQKVKFSHI